MKYLLAILAIFVLIACGSAPTEVPFNYKVNNSYRLINKNTPNINLETWDDWLEPAYADTTKSLWGGNELKNFYISYDENFVYIGLSGNLLLDSNSNTLNIMLDIDYGKGNGFNDFSGLSDSPYNVTATLDADIRLKQNVAQKLSNMSEIPIEINASQEGNEETDFLKYKIPINEITSNLNEETTIALIVFIGGGGSQYIANDTIPQVKQTDVFNFEETLVFKFNME